MKSAFYLQGITLCVWSATVLLAGCSSGAAQPSLGVIPVTSDAPASLSLSPVSRQHSPSSRGWRRACPDLTRVHCEVLIRTDVARVKDTGSVPSGIGPPQIQQAYNLPIKMGAGKTVAIVDAFGYPGGSVALERDLNTFRAPPGGAWNLGKCKLGTCLKVLNQTGKKAPLPPANPGWGIEEALDVDVGALRLAH
jgi:hypothetical protein